MIRVPQWPDSGKSTHRFQAANYVSLHEERRVVSSVNSLL